MLKCYNILVNTSGHKPFKTSIELLSEELIRRGYILREMPLGNKFYEFTAPNGWRWLTRRATISYPFVPAIVAHIARHKDLAYAFADFHGTVTPQSLRVPERAAELPEFVKKYAPVIVKPSASFGGHGLTMNITSLNGTKRAVKAAQKYAPTSLVQRQFNGDEVRLTVINGEVVSVLFREIPRVTGDGKSTVAQLVAAENELRRRLPNKYVPYPQLDASIIDEKCLRDRHVPRKGEIVELGTSSIVAGGAQMHDVTGRTHESYKALARRLAGALNAPFVVVDLLVHDFTKPLSKNNYVFLEFNTTPSLRLYYEVRTGNEYDIVHKLADMIDEESTRQ